MTELEAKEAFAIALLHNPSDSFNCARKIFGADIGKALKVHNIWPVDVEVLQFQAAYLKEHGADKTLPTKEKFARTIFDIATDKSHDLETRLKYFKLFGDIEGYIQKPGVTNNITTNNQVNNKVMVISDHGGLDDWEKKAEAQQKQLVSDNV